MRNKTPPSQGDSPEPRPRVKQWATKTRTGCLGCRVRRVRCDELRPKCKSCAKRHVACHYERQPQETIAITETSPKRTEWIRFEPLPPSPPDGANYGRAGEGELATNHAIRPDDRKLAKHRQERYRLDNFAVFTDRELWSAASESQQVPQLLIPQGWAVIEAVAYRNKVVKNDNAELAVANSSYNVPQQPQPFDPYSDVIVAAALCARIRFLAVAQGTIPEPSATDDTSHLWSRLYQLLNTSCQAARNQITDIDNVIENKVLQRICKMSSIEDYLLLPGARAHLEGFLALLRRCGTPAALSRKELSLGNAIHRILINAVAGNTLTRHTGGFAQLYTFTHQELTDAYKLTLCNDFPCPSFLWAQILEISELRGAAYLGISSALLKEKSEKIYNAIAEFAPEAWTEPYPMPKADAAYLLASIFKAACSIYCCCSYPLSSDPALADWIDSVKAAQRKVLLRLVCHAFEKDNLRWCLTWPLAVLGYAVDSGSFAERATVGRLLAEMGSEYSPMPPRVRVRLEHFWRSGDRSWDQCWHEPVIFTV